MRALEALLVPGPATTVERTALALLCAAVVVATSWALRIPLPLGHDESVYAVGARHWLEGGPDAVVGLHRAPLLSVLGLPILAAGGGGAELRLLGVVSAVLAVIAVWWLGRVSHSPLTGLIAASGFVFAPSVFEAGTVYLTDLPATAVLVLLAGLLWQQFAAREAPDRRLLLAAPLAWAAYELRYGSALPVTVLFLTSAALFWPRIRAHGRLVVQTLALLLLLLVPHAVNATRDVGSPWGRLLYTSEVAGRDAYGQGLREYVQWFPEELAGSFAAALMVLGLLGAVFLAPRLRGAQDLPHVLAFLVLPAVAHMVAIGIASHGDPRFVFFAVALLGVAGAAVLVTLVRWLSRRSVVATAALLGVLVVVQVVRVATVAPEQAGTRAELAERSGVIVAASRTLASLSGEECSVLTTYSPQVSWYADCASYHFGTPPDTGREARLSDDGWMLLVENGKRQPEGAVLEYYLARGDLVAVWDTPRGGTLGSAALYRMDLPEP